MSDRAEYRVMINSDIEDYSLRGNVGEAELQKALVRVLDVAAMAAHLGLLDWRQPQGDGEFTLLPQGTDETAVLGPFVHALADAVASFDRLRMRLRLALHSGPIHVDGAAGSPGVHAVQVGRLVGAEPLRAAMRACPQAVLGVIVSDRLHDDFVGHGYEGVPSAEDFRHVHVAAKQQKYTAYLYLPGHNVHRLAELDEFDVAPRRPGSAGADGQKKPGRSPATVGRDYYGGNTLKASGGATQYFAGRDGYFGDGGRGRAR